VKLYLYFHHKKTGEFTHLNVSLAVTSNSVTSNSQYSLIRNKLEEMNIVSEEMTNPEIISEYVTTIRF
jgi:hypothetical protein